MPKRTDLEKILIIGSGPIVIGQACEFDYSGTQAVKALRREGFKVVLANSNPATIMTDPELADATYLEPLTPEILEGIIARERPQAILPTLGGQTALNLAVALAERGTLARYDVELIGARLETIRKAEDRRLFKATMETVGLDLPRSGYASSVTEAEQVAQSVGFPLVIRPSFTLGGAGSSPVFSQDEFVEATARGLAASPVGKILIEEWIGGWKEFELEVMRDHADNCVVICSIENLDPMGVHTGDSITVAPIQTLTDREYQRMRDAAFRCIRAIGVDTGGSNIQFAIHPQTGRMVTIEMNPRVSRSSALASKATGFPIAKIAALLAVGYRLDELPNDITQKTPACFEPTIDYVVVKIPRFAFEKFSGADQRLGTAMKSVGEVMALGRTFKEALQKAVRSLEIGRAGVGADGRGLEPQLRAALAATDPALRERFLDDVRAHLRTPNCDRIFYLKAALQCGMSQEEIGWLSGTDRWFLQQIQELADEEERLRQCGRGRGSVERRGLGPEELRRAKQFGFSDDQIGECVGHPPETIRRWRIERGILPSYKTVDTCAAEFPALTPYYYSTYETEDEAQPSSRRKIVILGGGPNRIGQGIEFDYCCVHAVSALQEEGCETIMVNCNPETVSTDYDTADKLYFEPLTLEDVLHIVERERPVGVVVQFGGQTPLNLAIPLAKHGVTILGTSPDSIDLAEDRQRFSHLLNRLRIPQAPHGLARSATEAKRIAERIGYPVMVRPSYVLGGRAMEIVDDHSILSEYITRAVGVSPSHPILIDKFLDNAIEIDVDALADGTDVYIGGIMEHIEEAGIHSGDSACVLPPRTLNERLLMVIRRYTKALAKALQVRGLLNLQMAVREGRLYVLEVNPRASRTVPFVSKATGVPLAKLAARIMIGRRLRELFPRFRSEGVQPQWVSVKEAVLPWGRFPGVEVLLGPEMRSTGEVMGMDQDFGRAFAKSQAAAGMSLPQLGNVLLSVRDQDKPEALALVKSLVQLGFGLIATRHTAQFFRQAGLLVKEVYKLTEGRPHVVDIIKNREVTLVINTPSGRGARSDGSEIRRAAIQYTIPFVTTLAAAKAALQGILALRQAPWTVRSLQEYYETGEKRSRSPKKGKGRTRPVRRTIEC